MLKEYIKRVKNIFESNGDRYAAHKLIKPILVEMSKNREVLFEIIKNNLSNPEFLKKTRHYSTLGMTIYEGSDFSFLLNIFPPLPDRKTDISFQSIHHHGKLLLTTVSVFGPGYNSILFKKGFQINYDTGETQMQIEKDYQNQLHQVDFVDCFQPHIVFYPSDFSATMALWCDYKKTPKDLLKKIGIIDKFKKPLSKLITKVGLATSFGLNKIEYLDFYTNDKKVYAMKARETYSIEGSNENFIQNICCFVQKVGFEDNAFLVQLLKTSTLPLIAVKYINMLIENETIEDYFFEGHLNIPKINLKKQDIITAIH